MALSKLLFEFFKECRCCRSMEPAPQYRDVRYNEIYQMTISKHVLFFILYSIVYFVLSQKTRFTVICFYCFRWYFAIVTTVQQKDQAEQIEELVPKRAPTSVAWNHARITLKSTERVYESEANMSQVLIINLRLKH